ncbi:unnamed protein product [Aphanomyces euteiches]|nr:hypothetical protein AeRB84_005745 [Aphanomyces euteiches]
MTSGEGLVANEPNKAKHAISSEGFLANGSDHFHETIATKALPQLELRFRDLAISADIIVASKEGTNELPTLFNHAKKSILGLSRSKNSVKKTILHPTTGVLKPGTMTLLLGQPGSGKSSFMKALAGVFYTSKTTRIEGSITYNGKTKKDLDRRLPQFVSYTEQRDHHYHTLTVQETLAFAHNCAGGVVPQHVLNALTNGTPEENAEAKQIIEALYAVYPEVVVQQLGLTNCKDTIVGNAMLRGVSGGERKRVTLGEMEFGMKQVSLMDEISTGLDAAATFDIVKAQRSAARQLKKTIVIALLQPGPEVFELFDDVIILNEGHVMYHGPRASALSYFESLGFRRPPYRDVADFLLDLGTSQQDQYVVASAASVPRLPSDYAALFRQSSIYHESLSYVDAPPHPNLIADTANHMASTPEFYNSFVTNVMLLIKRQLTVMARDRAFVISSIVMALAMALLYSSSFYQMDPQQAQVVIGVIFQSLLFFITSQVPKLPIILENRKIFYKQRDANFFSTLSYVVAHSLSHIPFAIVETLVFGNIMYWMAGFVNDAMAYVTFMLTLFVVSFVFSAWFFVIGCISSDVNVAQPLSILSVMMFILFGGFIIVQRDIPDYFIWLYWLNPVAWIMRELTINQYSVPEFQVDVYKGVPYKAIYNLTMGDAMLKTFDVATNTKWIGYAFYFMVGSYFVFTFIAFVLLEYQRNDSENHTGASSENDIGDENSADYKKMPDTPNAGSPSHLNRSNEVHSAVVPVTLSFRNLGYAVPNPKKGEPDLQLINGVSGYALPGTITALMGSTGAGKTTLMDVIAGRKKAGKITGEILLNGYPATDLALQRCTGYCEQMDIHSDSATFREALTFSAMLRQPSEVSTEAKLAFVEECLSLLELTNLGDTIVRGSSLEQMKRLTIGVELAAAPSVLFLDEPTSGLDARSAKLVMSGIRKIASTGRTVVCTIHQPSAEVFEMFDSLLLLKRGGQTVYFGDLGAKASSLINYFTRIPQSPRLVDGVNPATWMLECIGAGVEVKTQTANVDFVEVFQQSSEFKNLQEGLDRYARPSADAPELKFAKKRAANPATQCQMLVQRFMRMYWRTPSYNWTRIVVTIFLSVLFGLVFCRLNFYTFAGATSAAGMIFMTALFLCLISFNSVLPLTTTDREAFYRERASQTYSAFWYFVGSTVAELPYVFFNGFLFTAIFYPFVGFKGTFGDAVFYGFNLSLMLLLNVYMGQLMSYAAPTVEAAALLGILVNSIFFLFMGFNPPALSIPSGYRWLYHITPQKYSLAAMTASVLSKCENGEGMGCGLINDLPPFAWQGLGKTNTTATMKEFIEYVYEMKHDDALTNTVAVIGFIVLFRVLGFLALTFINHQKK